MEKLGYLGIDQYGGKYTLKTHPRKELLEQLGASRAEKMYIDTTSGEARHKGYIINGLWIDIFTITSWK